MKNWEMGLGLVLGFVLGIGVFGVAHAQDYGPHVDRVLDATDFKEYVDRTVYAIDTLGARDYAVEEWKDRTGGPILEGTKTNQIPQTRFDQNLSVLVPNSWVVKVYKKTAKRLVDRFTLPVYDSMAAVLIRDSTSAKGATYSKRLQKRVAELAAPGID